jgi:Pyruvate/2-oxoglutarate dehydrogenase complex, dihydrolipoamide acyltransferase (E2) component, and related enzymes
MALDPRFADMTVEGDIAERIPHRTASRSSMSDNRIKPIVMPKWGLSMKEGKVTGWLAEEGTRIDVGKEILEVETDKIAGVVEAADSGVLRRRVGTPDTSIP